MSNSTDDLIDKLVQRALGRLRRVSPELDQDAVLSARLRRY